MNWAAVLQGVVTAVALAIIFGITKLFQRLGTLETKVSPVITWYEKTSMDALKIATNPTSDRLAELADRYIAGVKGDNRQQPLTAIEKDELVEGLRGILNDKQQHQAKRQSASMSLRFIEAREGRVMKREH